MLIPWLTLLAPLLNSLEEELKVLRPLDKDVAPELSLLAPLLSSLVLELKVLRPLDKDVAP